MRDRGGRETAVGEVRGAAPPAGRPGLPRWAGGTEAPAHLRSCPTMPRPQESPGARVSPVPSPRPKGRSILAALAGPLPAGAAKVTRVSLERGPLSGEVSGDLLGRAGVGNV